MGGQPRNADSRVHTASPWRMQAVRIFLEAWELLEWCGLYALPLVRSGREKTITKREEDSSQDPESGRRCQSIVFFCKFTVRLIQKVLVHVRMQIGCIKYVILGGVRVDQKQIAGRWVAYSRLNPFPSLRIRAYMDRTVSMSIFICF